MTTMKAYRAAAERTEYERNLSCISVLKRIFAKTPDSQREMTRQIHDAESDLSALREAVAYESRKKTIGPATEFVVKMLPVWQSLSLDTSQGKKFWIAVEQLGGMLPEGAIVEPSKPHIDGSGLFRILVLDTVRRLPLSVKKALQGTCFMEVSKETTMGFYCRKSQNLVGISGDLDEKTMRETILHEVAHVVNPDTGSREQNERNANEQANEWMKLF